jgi:hypothetical protein
MNATAAAPAVTSTATFGLPQQAGHLIAKLRNMPPELLALITSTEAAK